MSVAYVVLAVVSALWVGFSGFSLARRAEFVTQPLVEYGVPRSWWTPLALAKLAGAAGLLVGLAIPAIGIAAAVGLILYFLGAVITNVRARSYKTVPFPLLYLVPVAVTLGLGLAA
ncbi:DoxX family protein [Kitasatospora sp. A2-31]|uniref:DoxX family protein n=1 Tax=Kitasatospora sp. A2-31 TaxID=2916414 RepID=UPI001EEE05AF|nr:DoxX family protein [Kitasatospora sp. A2-31]MCG6499607.1 DoxX family protein [Kitasatospora sp. A2-31]